MEPMNIIPNRVVIYSKDIQNITGRSQRTARKMMSALRKKYHKNKGDFITVDEFCQHTGIKKEQVNIFLK